MTKAEVKSLQNDLNAFFEKYLVKWPHLTVDGDYGHLTRKSVRDAKFYIGWKVPNSGAPSTVGRKFRLQLRHPRTRGIVGRWTRKRGYRRRLAQHQHANTPPTTGVGIFDGRKVANAAIPILQWCRAHGWHGVLVSGWRDPEYSEQLCYNMCGHPTCPGTCAGKSSNHVGSTPQRFAVDVSDYVTFKRVVAQCPVKPRIFNDLPRDPVHFSPNGH